MNVDKSEVYEICVVSVLFTEYTYIKKPKIFQLLWAFFIVLSKIITQSDEKCIISCNSNFYSFYIFYNFCLKLLYYTCDYIMQYAFDPYLLKLLHCDHYLQLMWLILLHPINI